MKYNLILGRVNAGKTLFFLNFSSYLGIKNLHIGFRYKSGKTAVKSYSLEEAKRDLVSQNEHKTRCLQEIELEIPAGKSKKKILLCDSTGITETIHEDPVIRQGMAQTLKLLTKASVVLHIIDTVNFQPNIIDNEIARFASLRDDYAILANKIDLADEESLNIIKKEFINCLIIPVSSKTKEGFSEVKKFVWTHS